MTYVTIAIRLIIVYNNGMNTNEMTQTEHEAILMANAYGVDIAIRQVRNEVRRYAFNNEECIYWMEVCNHLVIMRNRTMHGRIE